MKLFKKLTVLMLALSLVAALAACGGGAADASTPAGDASVAEPAGEPADEPADEPAAKDPTELVSLAKTAAPQMMNYDATMDMDMDMMVNGEEMKTKTVMEMSVLTDPIKMKMTGTVDAAGQSVPMEMYAQQEGDAFNMYVGTNGQWQAMTVDLATIGQAGMNASESAAGYLDGIADVTIVGDEQVNGVDCVRIEGVVSGDAGTAALENDSTFAQMAAMGLDMSELMADFSMPVTYWLDKETSYIVKMESDATEAMNSLYTKMFESLAATMEAEGQEGEMEVSVSKFFMSYNFTNINNATDFEIPAEALAAVPTEPAAA